MKLLLKITLALGLLLISQASSYCAEPVPPSPADSLYRRAESLLAGGDTVAATAVLDRALRLDKNHWKARLERGRLYLAIGDRKKAELEFKRALFSQSDTVKSQAFIGLGDIEASRPKRNWEAIKQYRIASILDPGNIEVCIKATRCALAMTNPTGYATADDYLQDIICTDPTFHDAYTVWRDTILIKTKEGMNRVSDCLERYIKDHRGTDTLWLDIAGYRYRCEEIEKSLDALKHLQKAAPDFHPVERYLLRARCQVEQMDLEKFQAAYDSALAAAERTGDFNPLISQASAIFRPEEQAKADTLKTAEQWGDFFRIFWERRDPDPLTPVNERAFEHYRRLREAERKYTIKNPYSKIWNSRDRYRHISMQTIGAIYKGSATDTDYDPDLFFGRNRDLMLGQRGLLYIRHGPPDEIERPGSEDTNDDWSKGPIGMGGSVSDDEIWRYRDKYFVFSSGKMGPVGGLTQPLSLGEYFFVPFALRGSADINKAMKTESFADMLPELEQDFYTVDFMADSGLSEFETYQSTSVEESGMEKPPGVSLAVFDNSWREMGRDSTSSFGAIIGGKPYWIGVNRLDITPGDRIFAARMDIPGHRAVQRHNIALFPFRRSGLELSGVVLGSPVATGQVSHSRHGIALLPRPSLEFTAGEVMTVYLEIYGLGKDSTGATEYTERVTITRSSEAGVLGKVKNMLTAGGKERSSSLTLSFDREVSDRRGNTVPETFTVDTSLLLPGRYRMAVEVDDAAAQVSSKVGCAFKLAEPE